MAYDFDTIIDRHGTASVKWDYQQEYAGTTGLLPLWVADMDFRTAPTVLDAIRRRVDHGIFGYVREPSSYFEAARSWFARRWGWEMEREWMVASPGVLTALTAAILAFSQPGDGVVLQPPVYHPFPMRIRLAERRIVENPLLRRDGTWQMDLDGLQRVIDSGTRILILCSPHNPVGRVWEPDTLARLAEICAERGVLIVSDEIHGDLIMKGHRHTPVAPISAQSAANTVTLVAATKTFNLAGFGGSITVVPDEEKRRRFEASLHAIFAGVPDVLGVEAAEAGWRTGEPWLEDLLDYIGGNYELLKSFLASRLPKIGVFPLEGTYLALLDMSRLGLSDAALKETLLKEAKVWFDEGTKFGRGGEQMQRMNLGCPRSVLTQALERLEGALSSL